jgi:pilus assembly protein Flp/PilA
MNAPGVPRLPFVISQHQEVEDRSSESASFGPRKGNRFMRSLMKAVTRFLQHEDGPTAVEYAVMLALIVVVCITAITALGTNANKTFNNVALNTAVGSS